MAEPIIIGRKFDTVVWLLVKAWCIGMVVFAVQFAILHVTQIDTTLPTFAPINAVVSLVMTFLFLMLAAIIFTVPLLIIAGVLAYGFHNQIWQHPYVATLITPIIGLMFFQATTHLFSSPALESFYEVILRAIFSFDGIAILIALTASTAYYSFTLRKKMLRLNDE